MLPGLTRTAAQPASIAAKTYFGWKWMSAITGICDFCAMLGSASASSWLGHGDAHDVAAGRGELGDLLQRGVDVGGQRRRHRLHGDGASLPTPTLPTLIWRVLRRGASTGGGAAGMPRLIAVMAPVYAPVPARPTRRGSARGGAGTTRSPTISTTPITSSASADDVGDRQQLGDVDVARGRDGRAAGRRRGGAPRRGHRRCGRRRAAAAG